MTDEDIPQWKLDLIEQAKKLIEAKEENQRKRQEWLDTQPPIIKNTSIGK